MTAESLPSTGRHASISQRVPSRTAATLAGRGFARDSKCGCRQNLRPRMRYRALLDMNWFSVGFLQSEKTTPKDSSIGRTLFPFGRRTPNSRGAWKRLESMLGQLLPKLSQILWSSLSSGLHFPHEGVGHG